MNNEKFWMNFSLGTELDIAGNFIYHGLKVFDELYKFKQKSEIFEFLYNISVGIERLEKIAVVLLEYEEGMDIEELESSLITHNHVRLAERINNAHELKLSNLHTTFLQLISKFYKTSRYDRFNLKQPLSYDNERVALVEFIEKNLGVDINYEDFFGTENNKQIKKFITKIIKLISIELYNIIVKKCTDLNIYTYELQYYSKASKIFLSDDVDFVREEVFLKEVLIYLMNTNERSKLLDFMRNITPLDFDIAEINDYIHCLNSDAKKLQWIDTLDALYEEVEDCGARLSIMDVIGNLNVYFDDEDEDYENEDEDFENS